MYRLCWRKQHNGTMTHAALLINVIADKHVFIPANYNPRLNKHILIQ